PRRGRRRTARAGGRAPRGPPACAHDHLGHGLHPARLEWSWPGQAPEDGAYDLRASGYASGAWGRAQARGSYYGNFFAWARLDVEAKSPSCHAEWSLILGKAGVTGNWARMRDFTGWNEVPDLKLVGFKTGEHLARRETIHAIRP